MAFDRPLEADRVDDLGLLSTFVRAPIVGPIMWILGRKLAEHDDEEKENNLSIASTKTHDTACTESSSSTMTTKHKLQSSQACGSFPDIASTAISDIMQSSSMEEDRGNNVNGEEENSNGKLISSDEESKHSEAFNSFQNRKKSRKMSWSDESGQNLVEYCDLVSKRVKLNTYLNFDLPLQAANKR